MLRYAGNNKGVALVIVMSITAVIMIILSVMLSIPSSEGRLIFDYGNNTRAFYIAESGADVTVAAWRDFINSKSPVPSSVDIRNDFFPFLDSKANTLVTNLKNTYGLSPSDTDLSISFDYSVNTLNIGESLTITVLAKYEEEYQYKVTLSYDEYGNTEAVKGE